MTERESQQPTAGGHPIDALLRAATLELAAAEVPSPAADAEALLAHTLGVPAAELRRQRLLGQDTTTTPADEFAELVQRRSHRVPLQHLTGQAHFAGVQLHVGPGVFVPRPETEVLVELALDAIDAAGHRRTQPHQRHDAPVVVDLCTGSGAIAVAMAAARPQITVGAVELSATAYHYARQNVAALAPRVDLRRGPAQDSFPDWAGAVDVVVANPPYIPPDAVPIEVEVREHDPARALYGGGPDGLDIPLTVAVRAAELLVAGGVLLMEHADSQGEELPARLAQVQDGSGNRVWSTVTDHRDLAGRPRVTRAVRAVRAARPAA